MEFSVGEYQQRVKRARALMAESNLDALMVSGDYLYSANYRYLTGHLPRDFQSNTARPHILLLLREGGAAISVIYFSEASARQCWIDDIHVYAQPFGYGDVLTLFQRLGVSRGRVGVELGLDMRLMMPVGEYERLKDELPDLEWVDAAPLLWRLRMIKSPAEIECIKEANRINGEALRKTFGRARIGMTEKEIYQLCVVSLIEEGALRPPHTQMTISSSARKREKGPISFFSGPSDIPLEQGDVVFIDSGAIHNGYWGEFNRMAVMGVPSKERIRDHNTIRGIVREFVERVLGPAMTCEQAMRECFDLYEKAGVNPKQYASYTQPPYMHLCHGLGLNSSEPPLVRITDQTVIEPGMVFSVEAYLQGSDILYGSEEDVLITQSGCELLSEPDSGLYVIE